MNADADCIVGQGKNRLPACFHGLLQYLRRRADRDRHNIRDHHNGIEHQDDKEYLVPLIPEEEQLQQGKGNKARKSPEQGAVGQDELRQHKIHQTGCRPEQNRGFHGEAPGHKIGHDDFPHSKHGYAVQHRAQILLQQHFLLPALHGVSFPFIIQHDALNFKHFPFSCRFRGMQRVTPARTGQKPFYYFAALCDNGEKNAAPGFRAAIP